MSNYSITLSKKHGLNPSLTSCPICGKETGGIALMGRLKDDAEAPKHCVTSLFDLCDDCKARLDKAVLIYEMDRENNEPTGRYIFVPKDAIKVEVPKGIALMDINEFKQMFEDEID